MPKANRASGANGRRPGEERSVVADAPTLDKRSQLLDGAEEFSVQELIAGFGFEVEEKSIKKPAR